MMEILLKYWPVLLFVLNFLGIWVGWSVRKGVATQEDLKSHAETTRKQLDDHSGETNRMISAVQQRLTHLEARIEHGPSEDDLRRLHARLDDLNGGLAKLTGEFSGVRSTLELLHEFLLEEGKRK